MATRVKPGYMIVSESPDKQLVAVSVGATASGSCEVVYYDCQSLATHIQKSFLCGEDYPALVHVWDNKYDDIFDNL